MKEYFRFAAAYWHSFCGTGGVNFDAKVRRNSTDPEDLFVAHVTAMDVFA